MQSSRIDIMKFNITAKVNFVRAMEKLHYCGVWIHERKLFGQISTEDDAIISPSEQ